MNKGKLIVFEGADGTGKTTQVKLLVNFLKKKKIPVVSFSFPQYESAWGKMIRRYLNGEFGDVNQVNPYIASLLYAGDRLMASEKIKKWLSDGKVVVCDRYFASNIAHQAAKLKAAEGEPRPNGRVKSEKLKFISWLEDLEYKVHGIPKPDLVVLLTIPNDVAQKFMKMRKLDIHEKDKNYQKNVARTFEEYAKGRKNWVTISNMGGERLKPIAEVAQEVVAVVRNKVRP